MKYILFSLAAPVFLYGVQLAYAQDTSSSGTAVFGAPVTIALPIVGTIVGYGDIIAYDNIQNNYILSQKADDSRVYGVAVKNPAIVLYDNATDVPVARSGRVLVNVTLENGPIAVGDGIVASSIPGKGMRATASSANIIGYARESFSAASSSTVLSLKGTSVKAGTIIVELSETLGTSQPMQQTFQAGQIQCTKGTIACSVLQKIDATPLVTLMRYVIAAVVILGSLYLAFRSFMANAINGVISVGRNPRAKGIIQAMVIFNALLAGGIAIIGLAVGMFILLIKL